MSLNFDAFSGRDLQLYNAILQELEAEGVTSLPIARQRVAEHIRQRRWARRRDEVIERRRQHGNGWRQGKREPLPCPSCGQGRMVWRSCNGGAYYCTARCGYSELEVR